MPVRLLAESQSSHSKEHHDEHESNDQIIMFLAVTIMFGAFISTLSQRLHLLRHLPYTVVVLLLGIIFGVWFLWSDLGYFGNAVEKINGIDPHLFLIIFLPPLIFESSFSVNFHILKREAAQALVLAGPGVVISMILTAVITRYVFPYDWDWPTALTFGAMMSATDPVAVVALLKSVGASKRLATLIEAESLFNDGTAFVFFLIWKDFLVGVERNAGEVTRFLFKLSLGGVSFGLAAGFITVCWIANSINQPTIETSITLASAYFTFWVSESEDVGAHVSGVLAVVTLGLVMSKYKSYISIASHETLHSFWEVLGYLINTLIFFVSGLLVAIRLFSGSENINGNDFGWLILLYVFLHIIRTTSIALLYPILVNLGYGFDYKTGTVLVWGGLRGAVSLALALIIELDDNIDAKIKDRILFHTAGIVLLTITINGSTTSFLLKILGLTDSRAPERRAFRKALASISDKSDEITLKLRRNKNFVDANWNQVEKMLPKYEQKARELVIANTHIQEFEPTDEEYLRFGKAKRAALKGSERKSFCPGDDMLEEMYHRLLTTMKADFHKYYESGNTTPQVIAILDEAAQTARDIRSINELWDLLEVYFKIPGYFSCLENCWPWLARVVLLERLSVAVEIVLAFLHACDAAHHLDKFFSDLSDKEGFEKIQKELNSVRVKAEAAHIEIQTSFPTVYRVMQTEKAARLILKEEEKVIKHLYHEGILQDREYDQMIGLVMESEFTIETHPLRAQLPKENDVMQELCFWEHISPSLQARVKSSRRMVLDKGDVIPQESGKRNLYIVIKGLMSVVDEKKRVIETLSISDTLGMWTVCSGEAPLGEAQARSQPLILAKLGSELCKDLLASKVGPFFWRLAGCSVLTYQYADLVRGYSRFTLEQICLDARLKRIPERKTVVIIEWPTLVLNGSATHILTGTILKAKALLDPIHAPVKKTVENKSGAIQLEVIDVSKPVEATEKNAYELAPGSLIMILNELDTTLRRRKKRSNTSPDPATRRCLTMEEVPSRDYLEATDHKRMLSIGSHGTQGTLQETQTAQNSADFKVEDEKMDTLPEETKEETEEETKEETKEDTEIPGPRPLVRAFSN
ncbi:hypothetical protein AAMO2058_000464900 [Amorphochlora amoebiformis]